MIEHQPSTNDDEAIDALTQLSADDIAVLRSLPITVVAAAAAVEVEDGRCSMSEILAGIRGIIDGAESFPENELITAAFEAYKDGGAGEAELLALCRSAPPDLAAATLNQARQAAMRFGARTATWPDFAEWLRDLADLVVAASTAGGLLGIGGERVTPAESAFVWDLAAALEAAGV